MQPLDPAPLLQPHYRPSSLERTGPPQSLSSVLSPYGFRHLNFSLERTFTVSGKRSLLHPSPGSRSSAQEPGPGSRPLHAGCRAPSNQVSGALIPEEQTAPGSGSIYTYRRVIEGLLALVSPDRTCPDLYPRTLPPTLTTAVSLEWFEARSWKLASKDLRSSLTQLMHAQVSFSFRNLLLRALRHTSASV